MLCNYTSAACYDYGHSDSRSVTFSSDGFITKADYACASGYMLVGSTERICLSNGTWSSVAPKCGKLSLTCLTTVQCFTVVVQKKNIDR